jgi:lysozyme family protein
MATSDSAIKLVLGHEGGYVNDPGDPGGATKYGVTQKDYTAWTGDENLNVANLLPSEAVQYYQEAWWEKGCYAQIEEQAVADRYFDLAVNLGTSRATKCLQEAVNSLGAAQLVVDGQCGPATIAAVNGCAPGTVLPALQEAAKAVYEAIVQRNPVMGKFLNGWLNRLYH